jgi:hypothetical protein
MRSKSIRAAHKIRKPKRHSQNVRIPQKTCNRKTRAGAPAPTTTHVDRRWDTNRFETTSGQISRSSDLDSNITVLTEICRNQNTNHEGGQQSFGYKLIKVMNNSRKREKKFRGVSSPIRKSASEEKSRNQNIDHEGCKRTLG